jgi:hypothetical protein
MTLAVRLRGLKARLTPNGHILVMITRKTLETKVLIEWWWRAERYTKDELLRRFRRSGFPNSRLPAIPQALLLAESRELRCRGPCMNIKSFRRTDTQPKFERRSRC